jgi:hypothetical protein
MSRPTGPISAGDEDGINRTRQSNTKDLNLKISRKVAFFCGQCSDHLLQSFLPFLAKK